MLESARKKTNLRRIDLYEVFCAVLYLLKSGCQWRTVHSYFAIWSGHLRNQVDASKKVSGIKRHTAVDTQGLPHSISVTTAEITDRKGALQADGST